MIPNFPPVFNRIYLPHTCVTTSSNVLSVENITARFNLWLSNNEPILMERRNKRISSQSVQLPEYCNMLRKWSKLIDCIRNTSVEEKDKVQDFMNHLESIEAYCTNPSTSSSIDKKLKRIRAKRRRAKVKCNQAHVIYTPIQNFIEQIRLHNSIDIPNIERSMENVFNIGVKTKDQNENSINLKSDESHEQVNVLRDCFKRLENLLKMYKQRLVMLDDVVRLHNLRNVELIHRSNLLSVDFDETFKDTVSRMKETLLVQQTKMVEYKEKTEDSLAKFGVGVKKDDKLNNISNNESLLYGNSCCNHYENISNYASQLLFQNKTTQNIPKHWTRFFHQANFVFDDFLRIRCSWDKYLISKSDLEKLDCTDDVNQADFKLPQKWNLPLTHPSDAYNNDEDLAL